jgi:uncharacterized protein YajQ (UPF0234 family)
LTTAPEMHMAGDNSFDVVSQFDRQELVNAIDQTMREVSTRYDLKGTGSQVSLEKDSIQLASASEFTLGAVRELLIQKAARRSLSPKIFDFGKVEQAARGTVRQTARLRQGIEQDLAREISKLIRDSCPKIRPQIQGDAVRVSGKNKDDLQAAIKLLRERDYPVPLQFVNYR